MAWGETSASYRLPTVSLLAPDAGWLSDAAVSSWTIDRQLVGSTIPGNIRSANGLSIGAASVSIVNTGARATPWSPTPDRVVTTGASASLVVEEDGEQLPLGAWVVAPTSGSLTTRGIDVELYEAQYVGRGMAQALEPYGNGLLVPFVENSPVDPCWTVGRLAAQAGFDPVPPPVPSALVALPLHGGFAAVPTDRYEISPFLPDGNTNGGWALLPGDVAVGTSGPSLFSVTGNGNEVPLLPSGVMVAGGAIYFTVNVHGEGWFMDFSQGWLMKIVNDPATSTFTLAATNDMSLPASSVTFVGQQSPDWPNRVQVEMKRDWNAVTGQWTQLRVRVRSSHTAAWSSLVTHSTPFAPAGGPNFETMALVAEVALGPIVTPTPGEFAALQISTEADPDLWAPSKAHLKPLGGDVGVPWVPAGLDVWAAIQDCCSAWLGAAIMGTDGVLRMLDKDDLSGALSTGEVTDIGRNWTDLPWELDPADSVDRVAVTYAEPTITQADLGSTTRAPTAWRSPEVISVAPGNRTKINVEFENKAAAGVFDTFISWNSTPSPLDSQNSYINVYGTADGTGAFVPANLIRVDVVQTSATTAVVNYHNVSAQTQYLVTNEGEPSLVINAAIVADYSTPQVVERGLPDGEAQRALEVDLTPWVQRSEDAEAIADYLWSRLSGTRLWKVNSVRVRLDWSHELGKVLRLVHDETGLEAKALITRVHYEGKEGETAQTLDLVLLPYVYADFAAAWEALDPAATYADLATAQAGRTYEQMAADNNWTGA